MEHANLAWLTLALCASVSLLVCGARAAAPTRLRRAFCFFHGSFGLLLATHLVNRYLALNLPGSDPNLLAFVRYLENPALLLVLAVAAPVLVHELTDCPQRSLRNLLAAGLALTMLFLNYSISLFHTRGDATRILIKDGLFILIVAYCLLLLVRAWQRERDTNLCQRRRRTALIMSTLFPAIIADTFFDASLEFKLFPIVHLVFGIDLLGYLDSQAPAHNGNPAPIPRTWLARHYGLTGRETDILELAIQGLTHTIMAKRLSISTNTVKSHLRTIYCKMNVSNRVGLLQAINARPVTESENPVSPDRVNPEK